MLTVYRVTGHSSQSFSASRRKEQDHTFVHSDSGSCAWGSGVCARRVEQQQQQHFRFRRTYKIPNENGVAFSFQLAAQHSCTLVVSMRLSC